MIPHLTLLSPAAIILVSVLEGLQHAPASDVSSGKTSDEGGLSAGKAFPLERPPSPLTRPSATPGEGFGQSWVVR
jgi:hypothetical protein